MWRNVCLRNPFSPFLLGTRIIHSPWEPQHPPALHGCIIPKFVAEKERVWSRSRGLQELLQYTDCADKAFSLRGLEAGLWAFRLPMFATCDDMLFSESIPAIPLWNSKPPLPTRSLTWGSWDLRHSPPVLHHGCIMPIPSLQLQKEPVIYRETEGLVTELWSPRFVTIQCLCSQLCYVTAANQWTIVEIEILATVSWTCGCQPFSCRCSQNVTRTHSRKEIYATCLSKESISAIPCWNSKHPLATRSFRFLRSEAHSTRSLWLHHACKR